jgi:predicted Zn-dependent protease
LSVADALEQRGDAAAARQIRTDALRREPTDPALRTRLIHDYYRAGDLEQVRWLLTPETAGNDPALMRLLARLEFSAGRAEEARRVLTGLLALPGDGREELLGLSRELADERQPEAAFVCAELFAETAALVGDWDKAAAALQEFLTRVPNHLPALMKLVELCVDGGLNGTMYLVQGQLADAYLAAGKAHEARVIAEDLVLRAPWQRTNIERCRRALVLTGDPSPDRSIADLLSGDTLISFEDL